MARLAYQCSAPLAFECTLYVLRLADVADLSCFHSQLVLLKSALSMVVVAHFQNIKPIEALSKLFFPNYDNFQVASMLAADPEFIIILKKQIQ